VIRQPGVPTTGAGAVDVELTGGGATASRAVHDNVSNPTTASTAHTLGPTPRIVSAAHCAVVSFRHFTDAIPDTHPG
jgi:hypothetical protein